MNEPLKNNQPASSSSDSFFGMALTQAFMGFAFGADVGMIWQAGETTSAIYEDRIQAQEAMAGHYKLGAKHSLGGVFTQSTHDRGVHTHMPSLPPMRSLSAGVQAHAYGF